jgi:hypothetical protein
MFQMASFLQVSPPKPCMHWTCPHASCMPPHLTLLGFIVLIIVGEKNKSQSSALYSVLQRSVTPSLVDPSTLLSSLFRSALGPCSALDVRDQVSQPCRRMHTTIVLYVLFLEFNLLLISSCLQFWFVGVVLQIFELTLLSRDLLTIS